MGIWSDKYESEQCAPSVGLAVIVIATIDLRGFWIEDIGAVNDQVWWVAHISAGWVKNIIAVISSDKVKGDYYSYMMDRVTCFLYIV